jgi:anaerobic magnesium-protoporphyrin IX monomethyl ester cyclase
MSRIVLAASPVVYARQPGIGLAYLSAYLKSKGHKVKVMDFNTRLTGINDGDDAVWGIDENAYAFIEERKPQFLSWIDEILDYAPDIVGFNVWSTSKRQALYMARKIKQRSPGIVMVFGGPEAVLADNLLKGYSQVDIMVRGEGEASMADIAERFDNGLDMAGCPGCLVRQDGEMVLAPDRPEIEDLDSLPFPDFSDFEMDKYLFRGHIPISFSRGCKWRCSFCTVSNCWKKYRSRTAANVMEEIKTRQKEFDVSQFVVCDPAVNQDIDMLKKMRKAGCVLLNFGVESGSENVLRSMGKRYVPEAAEKVIRNTKEAGIDVVINIIVGYPNETEEDFQQTMDFIKRIRPYVLNIAPGHPCLVVPYNRLFTDPDKYGVVFDKDKPFRWHSQDGLNDEKLRNDRARRFDVFLEELEIPIRCGDDDRMLMGDEGDN